MQVSYPILFHNAYGTPLRTTYLCKHLLDIRKKYGKCAYLYLIIA